MRAVAACALLAPRFKRNLLTCFHHLHRRGIRFSVKLDPRSLGLQQLLRALAARQRWVAPSTAAVTVAGLGASDCPPPGSGDASEVALRTGSLPLREGRAAAGRRAGGIVGAVHRVRQRASGAVEARTGKLKRLIRLLRLAWPFEIEPNQTIRD
jgi:hypothetical protein